MRIYSSAMANPLILILFWITAACFGSKADYDKNQMTMLLGELKSLETEEKESILKSISSHKDVLLQEESKTSYIVRIDPQKDKSPRLRQDKKINDTNKNYDFVQWFATPSRVVETHVEGGRLESQIDSYGQRINNNHDYTGSKNTYEEDVSRNPHHDDHFTVNHHHDGANTDGNPTGYTPHDEDTPTSYSSHSDGNPTSYTSHSDGNPTSYTSHNHQDIINHDSPTSEVFYKKMKLKKVRRNCTRSKGKKHREWPEAPDIIVRSRSNDAPEIAKYDSNSFRQSVPALPEPKFNDPLKSFSYPEPLGRNFGFSGEFLHGIPRTHFFQYKDSEGANHYHLHNHNHIYDANGKKIKLDYNPSYRNLAEHFGKLKSMLTGNESPGTYSHPLPHNIDNYRSTLSLGDPESEPESAQKKGYHYTGTHESYGRKTYKRVYPETKSADVGDEPIGMEMYKYGAGQYATDEFSSHEQKALYPNEVTLGGGRSFHNSGEIYESHRKHPHSGEYNPDTSVPAPYKPYDSDYNTKYNHDGRNEKYNYDSREKIPYDSREKFPYDSREKVPYDSREKTPYDSREKPPYDSREKHYDPQGKSPYEPQDKAPYEPQDKAPYEPQDKAPYGHQTPIRETIPNDYPSKYSRPISHEPRDPEPYSSPYNPTDKVEPILPLTKSPSNPASPDSPISPPSSVTHSISYSSGAGAGADVETVNYGPENYHLYANARPDPDPLTIPKNAKVFEHYIRLQPMHFVQPMIARNPVNYVPPVGNQVLPLLPPKYPVPLHKLMPNPLKVPMAPVAPVYPRFAPPHLNQLQMLRGFQGSLLYPRLW